MALLIFVFHLIITPACSAQCEGHGRFRECCSGYEWNQKFKNCTKCTPGYFGVNCAQSCEYPSYGDGCQQECKCPGEECNVSFGCPEKATTLLYTTKQTTMKFRMSTENRIVVSTSIITEKDEVSLTSGESVTQKITTKLSDTIFTTQNLLIMGIFGVGLILVTLLVVFTCKFICKRLYSKRRSGFKPNLNCPVSVQEEIHYEEISSISALPNTGFSYSPLQQNESDGQNKSLQDVIPLLENQLAKSEEEVGKEDYENILNSPVAYPQNQQVSVTNSGLTDLEGYQLPHSSSSGGASGTMEEDHRVVEDIHCSERNDYLTVIPHNFQHQ